MTEDAQSPDIVATEAAVKGRLAVLGCVYDGSTITADGYRAPNGRLFHFPKPFSGVGYTQAQLDKIEQTLAPFDLDLFPLEPNAAPL